MSNQADMGTIVILQSFAKAYGASVSVPCFEITVQCSGHFFSRYASDFLPLGTRAWIPDELNLAAILVESEKQFLWATCASGKTSADHLITTGSTIDLGTLETANKIQTEVVVASTQEFWNLHCAQMRLRLASIGSKVEDYTRRAYEVIKNAPDCLLETRSNRRYLPLDLFEACVLDAKTAASRQPSKRRL